MYVIGDVHGKTSRYFDIVEGYKYTVQVGDFGFSRAWNKLEYSGLGKGEHWVIPGNHDDYDVCLQSSYCLGDFGLCDNMDKPFFFVRGGLSIDRLFRQANEVNGNPKTWWHQEELTYDKMCLAERQWGMLEGVNILIAHCPPTCIIPALHEDDSILQKFGFPKGFRENTSILIQRMIDARPPKICVFGHHHKSLDLTIGGTRYIGLAELECKEI
jgi:hypothetical protein